MLLLCGFSATSPIIFIISIFVLPEEEEKPEFILINKEPEPDPKDPSKLIYTEDPLILHTPTGRIINYIDDEEHGIRLFWQPPLKEGEEIDPEKVEFLPLGFDEFYGRVDDSEDSKVVQFMKALENTLKSWLENLDKWIEEKKKEREIRLELVEKELELKEAELDLQEAIEDYDNELKRMQEEEEKKTGMGLEEEEGEEQATVHEKTADQEEDDEDEGEDAPSSFGSRTEQDSRNKDDEIESERSPFGANAEEDEEDEEDEDEDEPSSFGSAIKQDSTNKDEKTRNGRSPFAAASLSCASSGLISVVSL